MAETFTDNTGDITLITHAGRDWVKSVYPSYRNYRSTDGQIFIGQGQSKYWHISVKNAAGEFDTRSRRSELFLKPEEAMTFLAQLDAEVAA